MAFLRRIHGNDVEPGLILQDADAAAGPLVLRAGTGRHGEPMALDLCQIVADVIDLAVLVGQALHHVVHRLQQVGVVVHLPRREGLDVVAGLGLGFGGDGQDVFLADGGDEVGLHLDLVLGRPRVDLLLHYRVAGRHPMVPECDRYLSGCAPSANMHQRQHGSRGG